MHAKDIFLDNSLLFNKRFSKSSKLKYLKYLENIFNKFGYSKKNIKVRSLKVKNRTNYNLYVGNFSKCNKVIISPYDTPAKSLYKKGYIIGDAKNNYFWSLFSRIIPFSIYSVIELILIYYLYLLIPKISVNSMTNQIFGILGIVLLVTINIILSRGIPQSSNLSNSTMCVVLCILLCEKLTHLQRQKTCFVFTDFTYDNYLGVKICQNFINNNVSPQTKIVMLDSIGNAKQINVFSKNDRTKKYQSSISGISFYKLSDLKNDQWVTNFPDVLITNGHFENGVVYPNKEKETQKTINLEAFKKSCADVYKILY